MKYAYWGFGMLLFGVIGLIIIVMFETITLNNDSEYYVLKEAMEASMIESVDYTCYRINDSAVPNGNGCNGKLKISEQKFIESFTRRFAASITGNVEDYTLEFYDIMEMPPKATVIVKSKNSDYSLVSDEINIFNKLTGILEVGDNKEYKISIKEEEKNDVIVDVDDSIPDSSYSGMNDNDDKPIEEDVSGENAENEIISEDDGEIVVEE